MSLNSNTTSSSKIGPRAKCDQVVYEAIAKAAEIIVRGRCQIDSINTSTDESSSSYNSNSNRSKSFSSNVNNHSNNITSNNNAQRKAASFRHNNNSSNHNTSVSRFHLEVEEVDLVRTILRNWRNSLHIPLRLDIYYEYQTPSISPSDGKFTTTTRKELLERWCIDYLPTFDTTAATTTNNNNNTNAKNNEETIIQLRQVVKHVIVFLRVLNSFTRLMPGYKLYHSLHTQMILQQQKQQQLQQQHYYYGHGPGLRGGYYVQNQHPQQCQQQQQQSSAILEQKELIGGSIKFLFCVSNDSSHHPSSSNNNNNIHDRNLNQQRLFSSTTNNPFARHDLTPITTPYGMLHFTALYDDGLNVERVIMDRARRLMEFDSFMNNNNGLGVGSGDSTTTTGSSVTMTQAIPIQNHNNGDKRDGNKHDNEKEHSGRNHSSYVPQVMMTMNSNRRPSLSAISMTQQQQYHPHHQQQQQEQYQPQPMSLPNPTMSNNFISEHLIQDYARSPVMNNGIDGYNKNNHNSGFGVSNNNNGNSTFQLRERLSSDPGHGLTRNDSGNNKRVLSGLSLALMNDDQQPQGQELEDQNSNKITNSPTLSSSPNTSQFHLPTFPTTSSEEAASWKQRVALHHPPPSFDSQCQIQQAVSSSPQTGQQPPPASSMQTYGYGYNQGKAIPVPTQSEGDCNRPVSNVPVVNTPPQPLFIGSLKQGSEHVQKGRVEKNMTASPPFRNPTSLKDLPSTEYSSFQNNKSHITQQYQQSQRFETIGVSGVLTNNAQGTSLSAADNLLLPPLTTMDGLASSPFKVPTSLSSSNGPNNTPNIGSTFSSVTLGKGSAMMFGHDGDGIPLVLYDRGSGVGGTASSFGNIVQRSFGESMFQSSCHYAPHHNDDDEDDDDDMPFTVDDPINNFGASTSASTNVPMSMSSGIVSSDAVTSFAHGLVTAGPLKIFNKSNNINVQDESNQIDYEKSMASLTNQLDDLKSFGESIMSST